MLSFKMCLSLMDNYFVWYTRKPSHYSIHIYPLISISSILYFHLTKQYRLGSRGIVSAYLYQFELVLWKCTQFEVESIIGDGSLECYDSCAFSLLMVSSIGTVHGSSLQVQCKLYTICSPLSIMRVCGRVLN